MTRSDLRTTLSRLQLGLLRSDDLPGVATEMLAAGLESPLLVELAGLDLGPFDPRDASDLWERALRELDLDPPSAEEALLTLACPIARRVVEGRLDPLVGAGQIVDIGRGDPDAYHLVADFAYPVDVSGYYAFEPGLDQRTRQSGMEAIARVARQACENLLTRCERDA